MYGARSGARAVGGQSAMASIVDASRDPGLERDRRFRSHHPGDAYFFPALVVVIWAILLLGFVPEVIQRMDGNVRPYPWIIHVHAVVFFGWLVFLASQVTLIRTGMVRWHRRMGVIGVALAVAVVVAGPAAALTMHFAHEARQPPHFLAIQLLNIATFAGFIAAAVIWRKHAAAHKRLIFVGTLTIIGAGFGRIVRLLTGGPAPFTIIPGVYLAGDLLILSMIVYDIATRGRPHPVLLPAAGISFAVQLLAGYLLNSPAWIAFTHNLVN